MEKREPLCTVGRNVNWCSHYGKEYQDSSKFKIEVPYNPAISFLRIYLKEEKTLIQTLSLAGSLSMEFSRQEYWGGLPFPSPGDPPDPGIKPRYPAL